MKGWRQSKERGREASLKNNILIEFYFKIIRFNTLFTTSQFEIIKNNI